MTFKIPKDQNHAWPPMFGLVIHRWMERDIVFDETAEYSFGTEDDLDVNKLFGFGYFNGWHHKDSARFGWNYNYGAGKIRIYAYCYVNGEKVIKEICEILPHKKIRCYIGEDVYNNQYVFTVHDGYNNWHEIGVAHVPFTHKKRWKYKLGCFFGGNNSAPHEITIKISKK